MDNPRYVTRKVEGLTTIPIISWYDSKGSPKPCVQFRSVGDIQVLSLWSSASAFLPLNWTYGG